MRASVIAIFSLIFTLLPEVIIASNFIDSERYRGWYWFEEKPNKHHNNEQEAIEQISPLQAKREIEQFKEELDNLRYLMLARPNPENIRAYRDKEQQMWQKAMELQEAWDLANLLYPEQRDLINNPVNVHAVKAKRELIAASNSKKIKLLATEYELVLFFNSDCRYCQLFSPVLKAFSDKYGFKISSVSSDGTRHEYFTTAYIPQLIAKLGISAFPTVIAVSNDATRAFELIRGYVSISELEEYAAMAASYLADLANRETKESRVNNKLVRELK